jgi:hypothetical protein
MTSRWSVSCFPFEEVLHSLHGNVLCWLLWRRQWFLRFIVARNNCLLGLSRRVTGLEVEDACGFRSAFTAGGSLSRWLCFTRSSFVSIGMLDCFQDLAVWILALQICRCFPLRDGLNSLTWRRARSRGLLIRMATTGSGPRLVLISDNMPCQRRLRLSWL